MSRDKIFDNATDLPGDFEFNEEVAAVFGDMLNRSVPFYAEQQNMIKDIAKRFWIPGTRVADLGSSLGTTLINIARQNPSIDQLIGFDNSNAMLDRARDNITKAELNQRVTLANADLNGELDTLDLHNTSLVTLCWTLQFIRPLRRDHLIKKIYDNMVDGGALIVTDKVLTNDSNMNRFFIDFYYDYKRKNGYSEEEIINKREALENVLIPYRFDENFELFRRNGFEIVETFFQWYNFAGFLCVKNSKLDTAT
ncbi:MAG: carboxy-S-adenosyl-L-methionine synthase CmoA [Granulosicoccus sp.]|nr:carboxy-S-adenosyl-L-methionine synthase CmoA [Granulosicoccus sp.]